MAAATIRKQITIQRSAAREVLAGKTVAKMQLLSNPSTEREKEHTNQNS